MSRRAGFLETISNIFDFQRNRTGRSIILFIFGAATFSWLVTGLFNELTLITKIIVQCYRAGLVERPDIALTNTTLELGVAAVFFSIAFLFMRRNFLKNIAEAPNITLQPPATHKALIVMLSLYHSRGNSFDSPDAFVSRLSEESAREELLKSNWGPLVVAVEHHSGKLEHCWLVCTAGGSETQYGVAEKVVRRFGGSKVRCHEVVLNDPTDVGSIVAKVSQIYRQAALAHDLGPNDIIADFTSGTAAMTGGMILATIDDNRKIEYLRQEKGALVVSGRALSAEEIRAQCLLVEVSTTRALLPSDGAAAQL